MLCPKCSKKVIYNQKKCRKCGEVILWEDVSDISCVAYTPLSSSMADTPEFTAAGERGAFGTLQKNGVAGVKKRRKKLWALIGAACFFVIALGVFFVFFNFKKTSLTL